MVSALVAGALLGLSAGLAPGPLLAFVLAQTVRYGTREGALAALAPLVSDVPIVLVSWVVARRLHNFESLAGIISALGGLYLLYLALEMLRSSPAQAWSLKEQPKSLIRASIINFLNPHPYVFWISVGVPLLSRFSRNSTGSAVIFLLTFYGLLVGAKLLVAWFAGRSVACLQTTILRYTMRALALCLFLLSVALLWESYRTLLA